LALRRTDFLSQQRLWTFVRERAGCYADIAKKATSRDISRTGICAHDVIAPQANYFLTNVMRRRAY
jgi:hypothetical protein